nr:zinc finger protein 831 isoform X2 [Nerophis lumbriciformis]
METGKQEIKQAQKEKTAYKRSVPGVSVQAILGSSAGQQEPAKLCLPMPSVYSKETLPFLTLHIVGGLQSQPGLSLAAAAPIAKPKSSGKNVCPHCGRDCMKPSVLEKHLRCHTGERPFPCTVCGVSFKTQSNLYKHKRTQVHARLSYESEQSSVGSLEGISRDSLTPGSSVDECPEESLRLQQEANNVAEITCPVEKHNDFPDEYHKTETKLEAGGTKDREKHGTEQEQPLLNYNRHVPLQRQEATMFSKQWKNSGCKVKSKSHDSIDSGFSEGNDRCSTPAGVMPDHRLETFERSGTDHSEEHINTAGGPAESVRQKEQQALEERISKLISQNTSVVEDKLLENVRPRKTGLSKQGSIDLPMPYTFKDSFHFDMKINKALKVGLQRNKNAGFYRSAPTQYSTTMEHAPLVRSNSLQFSVTPQQPEKICSNVSFQSDFTTPAQRGRSAPGNQQSSAHHPLVRQAAIDCITATETCVTNSSVEEASSASLSFDGDDCDIHGEQKKRKFQRKKSQKFAYNKWYMYRGGSFKKLYSPEKAEDGGVGKSRKMSSSIQEQSILSFITKEADKQVHVAKGNTQLCYSDSSLAKNIHSGVSLQTDNLKSTLRRNLSLSSSPLLATGSLYMHTMDNTERGVDEKHMCGESDRKKQRTEEKVLCSVGMETDRHTSTKTLQLITDAVPEQTANFSYVNEPTNPIQAQVKRDVFSTATVTEAPSRSSAKNTFLPKYQLKLPNSAEPNSTPVAGHVRGSNMEVCPSQTKHLTRERDTSEGPESAGWRRFDSADANHRYVDMSGGDTGDRRGQKKMEVETLPARRWRTAVSNCRHTEDTVNKEREAAVKVESELAEQHGGISGQELQRATNTANNADFHGNFHVKLSDFPQRTLEMHSDSLSEQPNLQEMHSSLIVSVESTQSLVQSEANARLTQTLQDQNATTSAEKPSPNVDDNAASCFFVKSELQTSPQTPNPSTVAKTQQSTDIGHVCLCGDVSPRHAMTGENNLLEGTSVNQTKTLLRPRTDDQDQAAPESSFQSIHSHGDAGQRHTVFLVDPATECWSGGARPLPSCQEYTEDTSSSDDEGKLIIEL